MEKASQTTTSKKIYDIIKKAVSNITVKSHRSMKDSFPMNKIMLIIFNLIQSL